MVSDTGTDGLGCLKIALRAADVALLARCAAALTDVTCVGDLLLAADLVCPGVPFCGGGTCTAACCWAGLDV